MAAIKRSTLYDVAVKADVSIGTVSHVFHHPERVKDDTRAKVLKAAQDLHYFPSSDARGLASGKTNAIGLFSFDMLITHPLWPQLQGKITQNIDDENSDGDVPERFLPATYPLYVDEIEHGFELECKERNQALFLTSLSNGEYESFTNAVGRVDGIALFEGFKQNPAILKSISERLPLVLLSEPKQKANILTIQADNEAGINAIADHLVQKHHVSSMTFLGPLAAPDTYERYHALQKYSREHQITLTEPFQGSWLNQNSTYEEYRAEIQSVIERGLLPEAVVCVTDQLALSFIAVLQSLGLRVPEDVIVTGFDGIIAGRLSNPKLTTIRQPSEGMGRLAAKLLIKQNGQPWKEPLSIRLPVKLWIGESCGCKMQDT
ncbi:LacI family DNA-binding transcriptional regulator [Bifidobacterium bombi]|uniref:Transcriptional regulator, LacI family n=1 Tax=Bifidobacterium bombi DSM 19703 TaxID=1341695 RepID=A0A086BNK5_9BIFI|nr:LacI family DNA-binding transcriptional regulator [Bifidobacterium bombi]KFF30519.1 transcriptional regulator, LacI family [Bifidobacterium bombi DSM 19703]